MPCIRPHSSGRRVDSRPGAYTRHRRGRGRGPGDAGAGGHQTPHRARRGRATRPVPGFGGLAIDHRLDLHDRSGLDRAVRRPGCRRASTQVCLGVTSRGGICAFKRHFGRWRGLFASSCRLCPFSTADRGTSIDPRCFRLEWISRQRTGGESATRPVPTAHAGTAPGPPRSSFKACCGRKDLGVHSSPSR